VKHYDVIVMGAGAAGLFCAFTAAQRGRRVLVIEKANKVGKKILMSGGGRCNFTNYLVEADNFISQNPHFCKSALGRFTQWDFIALVEKHGIAYEERKHGQLFCKNSAKDILGMLLAECSAAGVEIHSHCEILSVQATAPASTEGAYRLQVQPSPTTQAPRLELNCSSLVIATGALSIPTLGGSGQGYELAQQFGIGVTTRRAGLVPFMFSDGNLAVCKRLSGLATQVEVSCNRHQFREQMLFTHRGISGPAILQISNYWHPGDELCIDLLPGCDATTQMLEYKASQGKSRLRTVLSHRLPRALVMELQTMWWPNQSELALADMSDAALAAIGDKLNSWRVKPSATEGYRTAEVTLGGVDTDSISSKSFEAKQQPGLYFVGEVLDVTGHLGGFNFQWAWSSGYSAGLFV
jgi:predicted Rossmann fold flavoprotein